MQFKFRLFNIPIAVGIDFFLLVAFLAINRISQPLYFFTWIVVVFVSIIVHELGHAFAFRRFGRTPWVRLYSFGGETGIAENTPLKPWQDIVTSIAGPLAGLATGASLYYLYRFAPHSELLDVIMNDVIWVNIGWGVLNLLPLYPLDGGRIVKIGATALFKTKGEIVFYFFSMAVALCAVAISLYFKNYWLAIIAGFLFIQNVRAFQYTRTIGKDAGLHPEFKEVYALLNENKPDEALAKAEALYEKAESPQMKSLAINLSAWSLYKRGDPEGALLALDRHTDKSRKDPVLYGTLLFETKRYSDAKPVLLNAFSMNQDEQIAWILFKNLEALNDFDTLYETIMGYPGSKLGKKLYIDIAAFFFHNERFADSFAISTLSYDKLKAPEVAYIAACSKCRLDEKKAALKWLSKAVNAGFRNVAAIESDPDLAGIKNEIGYKELLARMRKISQGN